MSEENGQSPEQLPPLRLVAATPMGYQVKVLAGSTFPDGNPRLHLRIEAANGSFNFLLPTDFARQLVEHLNQRIGEAGGIVVPTARIPKIHRGP